MDKKLTIFLDFDGCLNSLPYLQMIEKKDWIKLNSGSDQSWREDMCKYLDPFNILRLSMLISGLLDSGYNAEIVIHSSWRFYYSLDELRDILLRAGLDIFKGYRDDLIVDVTPISIKDRGESIRWYLDHRNICKNEYIIIEDLLLDSNLRQRQIKTEWLGAGFDDEKLKETLKLLGIDP